MGQHMTLVGVTRKVSDNGFASYSHKYSAQRCTGCPLRSQCYKSKAEKGKEWNEQLSTVFNRGFWDGYYQGAKLGEWCEVYGNKATEQKIYVGKCTKYFSKLGVGEFFIENEDIHVGDKILVTGNATGALIQNVDEIRFDLEPVPTATRGQAISIKTQEKVRPNDKLYLLAKKTLEN